MMTSPFLACCQVRTFSLIYHSPSFPPLRCRAWLCGGALLLLWSGGWWGSEQAAPGDGSGPATRRGERRRREPSLNPRPASGPARSVQEHPRTDQQPHRPGAHQQHRPRTGGHDAASMANASTTSGSNRLAPVTPGSRSATASRPEEAHRLTVRGVVFSRSATSAVVSSSMRRILDALTKVGQWGKSGKGHNPERMREAVEGRTVPGGVIGADSPLTNLSHHG